MRLDADTEIVRPSPQEVTLHLWALEHPSIEKLIETPMLADDLGVTPLMIAARHGKLEDVRTLIAAGAVVDAVDLTGWSPLMDALAAGAIDCAEAILSAQGDRGITGKCAITAFTPAAIAIHARAFDLFQILPWSPSDGLVHRLAARSDERFARAVFNSTTPSAMEALLFVMARLSEQGHTVVCQKRGNAQSAPWSQRIYEPDVFFTDGQYKLDALPPEVRTLIVDHGSSWTFDPRFDDDEQCGELFELRFDVRLPTAAVTPHHLIETPDIRPIIELTAWTRGLGTSHAPRPLAASWREAPRLCEAIVRLPSFIQKATPDDWDGLWVEVTRHYWQRGLELLLESLRPPTPLGASAGLVNAVDLANPHLADKLVGMGANPTDLSRANLSVRFWNAACQGEAHMTVALEHARIPPTTAPDDPLPPLLRACRASKVPLALVKHLLDAGADPNASQDETPLHVSARYRRPDLVSLLLESGACVDASDRNDLTPLLAMFEYSHYGPDAEARAITCLDLLIAAGASLAPRTRAGLPLAHLAFTTCSVPLLEHLRHLGIDFSSLDSNGRSILFLTPNDASKAAFLTSLGLDSNAPNSEGLTPLHVALKTRRDFRHLLTMGARWDIPDPNGHTVLSLARALPPDDYYRTMLVTHGCEAARP